MRSIRASLAMTAIRTKDDDDISCGDKETSDADGEAWEGLLYRDAGDGCAGVGGLLSAGVWLDDSDAGRWHDRVRRYDRRGERCVYAEALADDAGSVVLHHGGQRGGCGEDGGGAWRLDCAADRRR